MNVEEFAAWLSAQRGVMRMQEMTADLIADVEREESTVVSSFGTPVDNSGLRDCMRRGHMFVALVNDEFWVPPTMTMVLRNAEGETVGHDIPADRIDEFMSRNDIVFLSDNFVMYSDKDMGGAPVMEMLSQQYAGEDGSLPTETSAVLWYPSPTSGQLISRFLEADLGALATAIVGIDLE